MRCEIEWSFDGKLCQEYSYQKLSKSDNWFSSYSRKYWGCFFETQCISKMVKALDLRFGMHISRDSPDMTA